MFRPHLSYCGPPPPPPEAIDGGFFLLPTPSGAAPTDSSESRIRETDSDGGGLSGFSAVVSPHFRHASGSPLLPSRGPYLKPRPEASKKRSTPKDCLKTDFLGGLACEDLTTSAAFSSGKDPLCSGRSPAPFTESSASTSSKWFPSSAASLGFSPSSSPVRSRPSQTCATVPNSLATADDDERGAVTGASTWAQGPPSRSGHKGGIGETEPRTSPMLPPGTHGARHTGSPRSFPSGSKEAGAPRHRLLPVFARNAVWKPPPRTRPAFLFERERGEGPSVGPGSDVDTWLIGTEKGGSGALNGAAATELPHPGRRYAPPPYFR